MAYLTRANGVLEVPSYQFIPADPSNADWQKYLAFLAGGGVPNLDTQTPVDAGAVANLPKQAVALLNACAAMAGKTPLQAAAAFRSAWDGLP